MKNFTLVLMDSIAVALAQGYMLARSRLTSHPSPVLQMTAARDSLYSEAQLLRRQVGVFQRQRSAVAPKSRPHFGPAERLEILQLMRLRDWSAAQTAREFILHPNTLRAWIRELHGKGPTSRLFTATAWNRIDDAVRWAAQQIRSLCPEPEIGTRTIARLLVRAGAKISRATVQRVLREKTPTPPAQREAMTPPAGEESDRLLKPKAPNHAWHADLTTIRFLAMNFIVAVVMDGFSRKILKLKVYAKAPSTDRLIRLIGRTIRAFASPSYIITDHGCQFGATFEAAMKDRTVKVVHGRVRCPAVNGKIERWFRTFRLWMRFAMLSMSLRSTQHRMEVFSG